MKTMLSLLLACGVLVVACGSSSSGGAGPGNGSCAGPSGSASSDCVACVQGSCSAQYSAFCSNSCGTSSSSPACQSAAQDVVSCIQQHCTSQCGGSGQGAGGSGQGAGGSGGGTAGSSSGQGAGANMPGNVTAVCDESATMFQCTSVGVPASLKMMVDMQCVKMGGKTPATCSSAGLLGCCVFATAGEKVCFYTGTSETDPATGCVQNGGMWSTSP